MRAEAILFDKDGTFFDFQKTYGGWVGSVIRDYAGGDADLASALAEVLGYGLEDGRFHPESIVIAGTVDELAHHALPFVHGMSHADLVADLNRKASRISLVEVVPLGPFLDHLLAQGLRLGVATNDSEIAARAQLDAHGITNKFHYVAGYDSGFGAKPDPGMCHEFARSVGVAPERAVMVGDSRHDLEAGRSAGMQCVAVLTGLAGEEELAPYADAVLADIGELAAWLRAEGEDDLGDSPIISVS